MSRAHRAYALPLTIMLAGILAGGFVLFLTRVNATASTTALVLKRRQAFYVADAVARAATEIVGTKLVNMPTPDPTTAADATALAAFLNGQTATLQAELDSKRATLAPGGFTIHTLTVDGLGNRAVGALRSGPFRGMNAQTQPFTITVELSQDGSNAAVASMRSAVLRGTISMFQFFTFVDGYAYLYTGTGTRYAGRTHANGNICMGSGSAFYAEKLTASGSFYVARSIGCRKESRYHESERSAIIATRPLVNGLSQLNGCSIGATTPTECNGLWQRAGTASSGTGQYDRDGDNPTSDVGTDIAAATWRNTQLSRWNGQLLDGAAGVPRLGVPITGTPLVQKGRDASHNKKDNNTASRFLIDPVLAAEPTDVRQQKLAYKADIRILNGVWYKRDADHPERLGIPLWSDHPGSYDRGTEDVWGESATDLVDESGFSTSLRRDVGQDDLFPGAARPKRYSYYQSAGTGGAVDSLKLITPDLSARPVISYGALIGSGSGATRRWYPAYFEWSSTTTKWTLQSAASPRKLLQGTRSGFRDGWMQVATYRNDTDSGNQQRDNLGIASTALADNTRTSFMFNMLPINFDVEAFAAALGDVSSGELGAKLSTFNGIVWIGATWPGIEVGYAGTAGASDTPEFWPFQGRQGDLMQPTVGTQSGTGASQYRGGDNFTNGVAFTTPANQALRRPKVATANGVVSQVWQTALPYTLCSKLSDTDTRNSLHAADTDTLNNTITNASFVQARCANYQDGADTDLDPDVTGTLSSSNHAVAARPNAVRIVNARHIDHTVFPRGLTIATNLPAYILGDLNSTSVPADSPSTAVSQTVATTNWRPVLIAADTISYQSSAWEDRRALWNVPINDNNTSETRNAGNTTYNFEALAGWLESDGRGNRDEVTYFTRLLEYWCTPTRTERGSRVIGFASAFGLRFDWNGESNNDCSTGKIGAYDYNLDLLDNQPPGSPQFQVTATETYRRN